MYLYLVSYYYVDNNRMLLEITTKGIPMQCPNPLCRDRVWIYRGNRTVYASCPNCKRALKIDEYRITRKKRKGNEGALY
jgi:hypothetical protein